MIARAAERPSERLLLGFVGTLAFFAAWQWSAQDGLLNPVIFSSPLHIIAAFAQQWQSGQLLLDAGITLLEFLVGFSLATVVGVGLGVAMGLWRKVEFACDPFVWFLYSSPLIAFYPLIVIWLGFGFTTVVVVSFLLAVISIVLNTMTGVHTSDAQLARAVRVFGGTQRDVVVNVLLPSALPHILAGMRIGLERALIGVVLGEMFSSNAGLGFRIAYNAAHIRTADVFVSLTILIAIGVATNQVCSLVEQKLQAWKAT